MALRFINYTSNVRFLSTTKNSALVQDLSKSVIAQYLGNIDELLSISPDLSRYPTEQWEKTFDSLKKVGFSSMKFGYMISQHPKLLIKSQEKIHSALNNWRSFNFGEKPTYQLLERYPELLDIKNYHLANENLNVINSFVGQKNGYKVLRNSPNVATDRTDLIREKIEYLRDTMKVDPVEVYKSDVFSYDLMKIKTRHIFLERLGMYTKKKKEDNEAHETHKNPRLSKIMDSSDKRFATKVCHVDLDEYETFIEIYKAEIERKEGKFKNYYSDDLDDEQMLTEIIK